MLIPSKEPLHLIWISLLPLLLLLALWFPVRRNLIAVAVLIIMIIMLQ